MRVPKVDLRTPDQKDEPKKHSRFVVFFIVLLLTIGGVAFSNNIIFSDNPVIELGGNTFLGHVRSLVRSGDRPLSGEDDDRVNILIMGIGGEGHDGPQLTDTVILASFKPSTGKVSLLSVPRDLLINTSDFGAVKLNAVNAYAEAKEKGSGPQAAADAISFALDQRINYWARIDFKGFEKMIDAIGGVDVSVDKNFTDSSFPIGDGSDLVKTISFQAGDQHMDGKSALEFARSRHGNNGEGSDFARSKRQEKIILAVREKMLRAGTLLNPFTLNRLFDTVKESLSTNLATWETIRFARQASDINTSDVSLRVMSDENVLWPGMTDAGAFVLRPRNNDWSTVREFVKNVFDEPNESTIVAENKPAPVRLEIRNGTNTTGLAQRAANELMAMGFTVSKIGNAADRQYDKSVIYDLTEGVKSESVTKIRAIIDANVAPSIPASITAPTNTDFLIILGKNTVL